MSYIYAGRYGPTSFVDQNGQPQPSSPVAVYVSGTPLLATLWGDRLRLGALSNPFNTDALGNGSFYADPGFYDLEVNGVLLTGIEVGTDPAEDVSLGVADTITAKKTIGAGTPIPLSNFAAPPRWLEILDGSIGSPVTTPGPVARISRVGDYLGTTGGGSTLTNEKNAALVLLSTETGTDGPNVDPSTSDMQACALFAYAQSENVGPWDAVAINAVGRVTNGNTRRGTGAYLEGRSDVDGGKIGSLEVRANNQNPVNDVADALYNVAGGSNMFGFLVSAQANPTANPVIGAGIQIISADFVGSFGVGLGFCLGGTSVCDIQSNSQATTCISIQGTHTTGIFIDGTTVNPLIVSDGSGPSGIGTTSPQANRLHVAGVSAITDTGLPSDCILLVTDTQGQTTGRGGDIGLGGWTDNAQTTIRAFGVVSGKKSNATSANSTGFLALSAELSGTGLVEYVRIDGSAGVTLCKTATQDLGFYGHAGAVQQTVSGSRSGGVALTNLLTALADLGLIVDGTSA